jgi:hypothetical protein
MFCVSTFAEVCLTHIEKIARDAYWLTKEKRYRKFSMYRYLLMAGVIIRSYDRGLIVIN